MDQDSTNGSDKRNWRERLGIGSKELPRITPEFKPAPSVAAEGVPTPAAGAVRAAPRPAQPISRPAPMAPRVPPKAAAPAAPVMPSSSAGATPPDALADKLKAQRAAAERLAEQRVQAARERAEAAQAPENGAGRPKFTFAPDAEAPRSAAPPPASPPRSTMPPPVRPAGVSATGNQPQLAPPRPTLGGVPPQRPAPPPGYRPPPPNPQQGYRPIDPATGYAPQSYAPPPAYNRGYPPPPAPGGASPRMPMPGQRPPVDPYAGPSFDQGYADAPGQAPQGRGNQRLMRPPMRPAQPQYDDGYEDDLFEQAPPPPVGRRATAHDYNQAYRDVEGGYMEEPRRSRGPLWIMALVFLAAVAAGLGVWLYQTNVKTAGNAGAAGDVPVVAAPDSGKTQAEAPADAQPAAAGTPSKKQIYDRIVGDQEVLGNGQMTPTEEAPIAPDAGGQAIPEPASATGQSGEDVTPLPLPPPPGGDGTEGALPAPPGTPSTAEVTPAGSSDGGAVAPVPGESTSASAAEQQATPPAAKPASEAAGELITDADPAPAPQAPAASTKKKATAKAAEKTKTTKTASKTKALGAEPVVLVPPADGSATLDNSSQSVDPTQEASAPAVTQPVQQQAKATTKKKKTLMDLFGGNDAADTAPAEAQVASLPEAEPSPPPASAKKTTTAPAQTTTASTGGSGYVVQLASYKTEAEATAEYARMKAKHASVLGKLKPVITQASVGGSTRYRLAFGTLADRNAASQVCSALFSAGERDCLVRRQ
jgi:hypothetical protein